MDRYEAVAIAPSGRRNALSACLATAFGLASPAVFATVFVTNCNDAGAGSLRSAVATAPSGSTVNATGLDQVCSTITLKTGAIDIPQTNLTIKGPGQDKLTVTSKYNAHQYEHRDFTHTGTGMLDLQDITVSHGYIYDYHAFGGCIYSKGSVTLERAAVTQCKATNSALSGYYAAGGGIFARGSLTMRQSVLTSNVVDGNQSVASAGAATAHGFRAYYSGIVGNSAISSGGHGGNIGGVDSRGSVYLYNSVIGSNKAASAIGGLSVRDGDVKIVNSTISSNVAQNGFVGGAYMIADGISVQIFNSTISANSAGASSQANFAGLVVRDSIGTGSFSMQSSLVAGNTSASPAAGSDLSSFLAITGNNNLVQNPDPSFALLPADTIVGKCAFLGPLRNNGGGTLTQAPLGHSPALDAGNNTFGANFDQRGASSMNHDKNYPRAIGLPGVTTPRADIGAHEVNRIDKIYDATFDSC